MWTDLPPILSSSLTYPTQFPGYDLCTIMNISSWKLITVAQRLNICHPEEKKKPNNKQKRNQTQTTPRNEKHKPQTNNPPQKNKDITTILTLCPKKGRKSYISTKRSKGSSRRSWQVHEVTFESKVHIWSSINSLSIAQWSNPKLFRFINHIRCHLLYIPNGWTDVPMKPIFSISDWFIIWGKATDCASVTEIWFFTWIL